jgi:hypothetical protein
MTQPTAYNRSHDFTEELDTQHGINLDEELDNLELTVDELLANLALLQRDDTKLANSSVHPDALNSATLALIASDFTPRGEWVIGTVYAIGDIVEVSTTGSYVAVTAHTAGAVFATDKAAGKWISLSGTTLAVLAASTSAAAIGSTNGNVQSELDAKQTLDATLTALAALTIAANTLIHGTAADAFSVTAYAANTFPARASTGNLAAKSITDAALSILDDASTDDIRDTLGVGIGDSPAFAGLTVNGVAPLTQGVHTIPYLASAMVSRTTNGAGIGATELATNDVMLVTKDFDQTTAEGVQFYVPMPKSWNEGTVTAQFGWTAASGAGTVIWSISARAFSDDDPLDTAFGTAVTATDTLITANDMHISPVTGAMTVAGTPAESDFVLFQITRDVADTLNADAKLIWCKVFYTITAGNDA